MEIKLTASEFLKDQIENIKNLWIKAIISKNIVPLAVDVSNYDEGITILSNELCGPNDIRLSRELYPRFYDKREDLLTIFHEYFSPSSILNQEALFRAGILPTCAYVGEYALWHRKDYDNKTSLFPMVSNIRLPDINPQTNFFENGMCYKRVERGCNNIVTIGGWLSYYMSMESESISDTTFILSILETLSPGILTDVEKMELYVKCHESFFLENRDYIYKKTKVNQDKMVEYINGPKFKFTNDTLKTLMHVNKILSDTRESFFLPLTNEQQEIVNGTIEEANELYTNVENFLAQIQQ